MPRLEFIGDDILGVEIDDLSERVMLAQQLRKSGVWIECVEGMRSVVVQFDAARVSQESAAHMLEQQLLSKRESIEDKSIQIEIPVCYGGEFGPELESIAEMMGLTGDAVIEIHTTREHRVDLIGFTPGFAYVSGLQDEIDVPRFGEPRQRVAAGSIGIAGGLTGLYALAGPGGWPLIGRTPLALFDAEKADPFLLRTGMRVRFTAIDDATYRAMVRS